LTILGWHRLLHRSRVDRVDTAGMAADIAGNASHEGHSTDRTSVRLLLGYPKQTKPAAV
jgi:hypothetical protein